mmetsp:Transcript_22337/g.48760  ORF Transcript_22337/g.48760 Transcript_22337/m.48760 type:complete len:190 (+) Transcript_22337:80-649(+)|eukprot:CAMPEP_0204273796 /NCGR_PEP_ID=MMETSP0468-20130131/24348_1 /ASSEMBLY_ACC=CAM_ASM_000383 /TAXON_ID=2969 /ORGANISM="Oxyrrhis marina" /LENGTH=189 /DNA_ID=CAMNT_0051249905 /DNA_START=75 /DNA_END=644 /DNA_ORIENTATION=-
MPMQLIRDEGSGLTPLEGEEIGHTEPNVKVFMCDHAEGEGTLYLTNQRIVWLAAESKGFAMDYPFVVLHAISRSVEAFSHPCIYCQLSEMPADVLAVPVPMDQDDDEDDAPVPELRFAPANEASLDRIFQVFSEMAALNPDPTDDQNEEDSDDAPGAGGWFTADGWVPPDNYAADEDAEEEDVDMTNGG